MILRDELQSWGVALLLAGGFYVVVSYLFRSLHPTSVLTWEARRFRRSGALLILLILGVVDVRFNLERGHIGMGVAVLLWAAIGLLTLLLIRWWWQDRQREKAARGELMEKLHEEGRELVVPPMSTGKRVWRWMVNGYAIFLVAAGLYALVRYLVNH